MRGDLLRILAHIILEGKKSQNRLSASWSPWDADSVAQPKSEPEKLIV
jgi:hypothetical protein